MARRGYDGVVLAAPVTVPYQRYSTESTAWWIGRALAGLAATSGIAHRDFDGFMLASFSSAPDSAIGLTQHFGLSPRMVDFLPMGGAGGVMSLRRAARAVQAGDCDVVACVAADTNGPQSFRYGLENFSRFSQDAVYPYGAGGPNVSFALIAQAYMAATGATREDFGRIAVAQRQNGLRNPHALMRKPLSLEDYLGSRPIAPPIHLFDCVMPCAGAEAFLVMREETARAQGLPFARLAASIERHNAFPEDRVMLRGGWARDVDDLWAMAGMRPADMDLVQTYDDYPFISMMQFEDLGFCAKGEAAAFLRDRDLTVTGDLPHNTNGGQLSAGQAGCAGGHIGLVEALRQVTGAAGPTQVEGARRALVSGFGMINFDRGLGSGAVVLEGA
ncbi:thiolase family protein [Paracoccus sp. S-4012]|uniref:thiolase family protein n=1 Tax=Paracoccus sp. S-4012 TaxID=2665648 RepID=UPI0012AF2DE2|nr:thiolase family protein [Paracoccus sp. S-4012]MRX51743.1 thiolase family protein [Paracoccus sp. S-4012]